MKKSELRYRANHLLNGLRGWIESQPLRSCAVFFALGIVSAVAYSTVVLIVFLVVVFGAVVYLLAESDTPAS